MSAALARKVDSGHQIVGAAKIGDQLRQSQPAGGAIVDNRGAFKLPAAMRLPCCRSHRGKAAVDGWVVRRLRLTRDLIRRQIEQVVDRDLRIVFDAPGLRHPAPLVAHRAGSRQLRRSRSSRSRRHLRRRQSLRLGLGLRRAGYRLLGKRAAGGAESVCAASGMLHSAAGITSRRIVRLKLAPPVWVVALLCDGSADTRRAR